MHGTEIQTHQRAAPRPGTAAPARGRIGLDYRPWQGSFAAPVHSVWAIARVAIGLMFRRKLFWVLYAIGLIVFLMFFFGQYLVAWALTQVPESSSGFIQGYIQNALKINGTAVTYRNFFYFQGWMLMVILGLAGALLIGNDFQFGSLPFYLAKPLSARHYLWGKFLAVGLVVNMMTTLPALILFVQYRLLYEWGPLWDELKLMAGIVGYGLVLTVIFGLMLLATATWLRRTVPLIMAWTILFAFTRLLARALVDRLHYPAGWRLIDLWNNTFLLGNYCLGLGDSAIRRQPQPAWYEAALVEGVLCILCLIYLNRRVRAVEIVR